MNKQLINYLMLYSVDISWGVWKAFVEWKSEIISVLQEWFFNVEGVRMGTEWPFFNFCWECLRGMSMVFFGLLVLVWLLDQCWSRGVMMLLWGCLLVLLWWFNGWWCCWSKCVWKTIQLLNLILKQQQQQGKLNQFSRWDYSSARLRMFWPILLGFLVLRFLL